MLKLFLNRSPYQILYLFRRKYLKQKKLQGFDEKHPCVFVLSTGRVGTQTLTSLFKLAKNVFAYHEPEPLLYWLSKLAYENIDNKIACRILKETFLALRKEKIEHSLYSKRGYVETSPQTTFLAPIILDAIPDARFIHVVRDPRFVVRSGMRRKWYNGHIDDKSRIIPKPDSEEGMQWSGLSTFQKNLWFWTETNIWIHKFLTSLPSDRVLSIHSEELFTAHEETIEKLFAFINSPIPPKRKIMRVLDKNLNKQKSGEFSEISCWSDEMYSDFYSIAGITAELFGYKF